MGAITNATIKSVAPNPGTNIIRVETPTTAVSADTIAITLADYGITSFDGVVGFVHNTENSVVVAEAPTTAVSAGVLTLTVGGSSVTKKRVYYVYGI